MVLYIEVLNGRLAGQKFALFEGLRIGRKKGELLLADDPKVSGLHAKIELDNKNQFVLVDQDSSNGLVVSGKKRKKVAMLPGIGFQIGSTNLRVIQETQEMAPDPATPPPFEPSPVIEAPVFQAPPAEEKKEIVVKSWKEKLQEFLEKEEIKNSRDITIGAFSPALVLDFVEGAQADQKITLGYGPRQAGFANMDVELIDPKLPEKTFELLPGPGSVEIRDLTGGLMLINGRPQATHFLEDGDLISLGNTKIKVRYV